ncbi:hypothetical protein V7O66_08895 [Methanolobus sp. ZRKC3]|uniref:hypothetical protein n=1 Tax=Methanolobus sp. ZRKC3 TaxID=3125786 RepID=UPI0032520599
MLSSFSNIRMKTDTKVIYLLFGIVLTYFSSYFPDIANVIGLEGTRISSLVAFGSLNGMLFGPLWGSVVSGSGMFLHELNNPGYISKDSFRMLSPFFIIICSAVSGFVVNRNYKAAAGIFIALISVWYLFDTGRAAYLFPWFHLLVLASFLLINKFSLSFIGTKAYVFVSLFYAGLMGVLSDHLAGSIAYTYIYDLPAKVFNSVLFIYPLERVILALVAALIAFFFFSVLRDIILSSGNVEAEINTKKKQNLADYLNNDVHDILNEEKSN